MNITKAERERLASLLGRLGDASATLGAWAASHSAIPSPVWSDQDRKDYEAIRSLILNPPSVTMNELGEASIDMAFFGPGIESLVKLLRSRGVGVTE